MDLSLLARRALALGVVFAVTLGLAPHALAVRLKDFSSVKGVRSNQIIGYGLVVGLNGTGDKSGTEFTVQSLASMLGKIGVGVTPALIKVKNVAAVMVTAQLTPFARTGTTIDVVVSSLGDATSLEGGTLLMTPLFGTDQRVWAIAQGPLSTGGFSASAGGTSVQKNHPTVGRIANGASVERELEFSIANKDQFELALQEADFTTAERSAEAINARFGPHVAFARDAGTLLVRVPEPSRGDVVGFLAEVESLEVERDTDARVVLNERTGTVVMGEGVRISTVAVSHGSLSVSISTVNEVSQPNPFGKGRTAIVQNTDVSAVEEPGHLTVVKGPVTIGELVRGLNAMGVTPRDLIAILQAIKAAGALSGDLEIL